MATHQYLDRVKFTSTSTSTGSFVGVAAVDPTYVMPAVDLAVVEYWIRHQTAVEAEWGIGSWDATTKTLTRGQRRGVERWRREGALFDWHEARRVRGRGFGSGASIGC